jgi:DNA-binding NarL/FixJ family response regulator
VKTPARANPPGFKELTAREQEIFGMIIQGLSNREIGEALVISEGTVKSHVNRLLRKLDLRDRVHVLLYAAGHGMLIPQSGRSPS